MKQRPRYGKWYSVDECMPEDFEELVEQLSAYNGIVPHITKTVLVLWLDAYAQPSYALCQRVEAKQRYDWLEKPHGVIEKWMAIPSNDEDSYIQKLVEYYDTSCGAYVIDQDPRDVDIDWIRANAWRLEPIGK